MDSLFFSLSCESVWKALACLPKVSSSGFGYPLEVLRVSTLESFFQLSTLVGFSLQSFAPPVNRKKGFPSLPFVLALSYQPSPAWYRRFDDFPLTDSRAPRLLPEGLVQVGAVALWGLF